jgi:hypothetical protein
MIKWFIIVVSVVLIGCGPSIPKTEYIKFFKSNSLKPKDKSIIVGTYNQSTGLHGEKLVLNSDNTFFYRSWTDIDILNNPIKGYSGNYFISGDTLALIFNSTVYEDSTLKEDMLNPNQRINRIIYFSRLSAMYNPAFFVKYQGNIFILPNWFIRSIRENYSSLEHIFTFSTIKGIKYSEFVLIKSY